MKMMKPQVTGISMHSYPPMKTAGGVDQCRAKAFLYWLGEMILCPLILDVDYSTRIVLEVIVV